MFSVLSPLQLTPQDLEHLAALTGLTSLAYGVRDEGTDLLGAISQLTRLRSLQLGFPSRFNNAQLTRLSMLCGLTSLQINGRLPMQSVRLHARTCSVLTSLLGPLW